ncbi:Histone-lysine N-methyltransferase nsd2 [Bulinus truncatus]|nr:Histone-lysine N-methyltransferase nsd2 [Bulinus truncatus]
MEHDQGFPSVNINSSPAAGCHRLPQLPTMGRNFRTAQSKSSAKQSFELKPREEAAVLHVEGTSKIVKILTDGISEWAENDTKEIEQNDSNSLEGAREKVNASDNTNADLNSVDSDSKTQVPLLKKRRQKKTETSKIKTGTPSNVIKDGDNSETLQIPSSLIKAENNSNAPQDILVNVDLSEKTALPSTTQNDTLSSKSQQSSYLLSEDRARKKKESPLEKKKRASKMDLMERVDVIDSIQAINNNDTLPTDKVVVDPQKVDAETDTSEEQINKDSAPKGHIPRCVLIMPTEVPSGPQMEKLLSMDSSAYDLQYPPLYSEGDMLWAKVSGHPYWPCMVSRCPFSKMHTRIKGDIRIIRSYHVQFFGNEVERGWVNEPSLMPFEGKMKFLEQSQQELTTKQCKKGKSAYNPFKINITRRHAWNIAVEEAEGAMSLSSNERRVQYTFDYVFMEVLKKEQQIKTPSAKESKTNAGVKRKRTSSEGTSQSPQQNKNKKRKLEIKIPTKGTPVKVETSFDTYYAKHRSTVIEKHPEWDTAFVFEYLRQQWEKEKKKSPNPLLSPQSDSVATPSDQGSLKRIRNPSKLMKLLSEDSPLPVPLGPLPVHSDQNASPGPPRKRGRPPKVARLSEPAMVSSSPVSSTPESEDIVEETQPRVAASALSARKSSQESDSSTESKGKGLRENEPYELEIFKLNATCKIDKDKICYVCEKNGDVIECSKTCGQHFHPSCVNVEAQATDQYVCPECTSGLHVCFSCKVADMETVKCSVNLCNKYYHEDCVRKYRLTRWENKGFVCPLHTCATCAVDNVKNPKCIKGRFYRCIRCPTAYHAGDLCIAAGSQNIAGTYIICGDHFQPNKSLSCHSRLNITWCFSCSKGGTLLCCETCPAAFHAECVKVEKTPEEAWFCMDCSSGRKPLYGNIVWIKVGNYRWWPGEICHPRHVPLNIQEKAHQVGEFPVRFFGSHDYYWIHRGRVFLFQEGDKGSKEGSSRGLFKIYMKGVNEATEAFKLWTAAKAKKVEQEQERNDKKPAPYKFIKSNVPIGNVQICKAELSEIPRCECKPDQEDACTTDCLNRMMMYECHPNVCPAGEKCHNQRFQKRQYPECEPFKSETRGWGLRCLEDIKKGQFVLEYVGDVIDEEECKRRIEQAHEDNITNFYMLTMDKNRIIDAGPKGNFSRFMNHSCCPNLETQKWTVNGDIRVGLFSLCDIPKGSELTFNYNLECLGNEKKACSCGSDNCSGFLGVRPKTAAASANERKSKELKKKRRKKKLDPRKEHEDDCFRCGEGGELVMCDKGNCPKVYHLQCLKLTKPPSGKWLCPWHHCDDCGKLATVKCVECPNSYCNVHLQGNIFKVDGMDICCDHTEILEGSSKSAVVADANGIKMDTDSNSNESDATELSSSEQVKDGVHEKQNGQNDDFVLASPTNKCADVDVEAKSDTKVKPKVGKTVGSKAKINEKLDATAQVDAGSDDTKEVKEDVPPVPPIKPPPTHAGVKSNELSRGNVTRTKARYRARLTQAKAFDDYASIVKKKRSVDILHVVDYHQCNTFYHRQKLRAVVLFVAQVAEMHFMFEKDIYR